MLSINVFECGSMKVDRNFDGNSTQSRLDDCGENPHVYPGSMRNLHFKMPQISSHLKVYQENAEFLQTNSMTSCETVSRKWLNFLKLHFKLQKN